MNSKQLALRLAVLDAPEREKLLAELPDSFQQPLRLLINEVEPVLVGSSSDFEALLTEFETGSYNIDRPIYDEASLLVQLSGESATVKLQLVEVLINRREGLMTTHVQQVVERHLTKSIGPVKSVEKPRKSWWSFFVGMTK